MIEGTWIDEKGRVLEIVRAEDGSHRVTARPGEGKPPFPPSNLFNEDTVEARDLPAEECEAHYPLPTGSPCISVETGAPGYGRTLRLTLVALLCAGDEASGFRAPAVGDSDATLRLVPAIGSSFLDAVAYHEGEECYERLPWAEPLGLYRPVEAAVRSNYVDPIEALFADGPRDAENRLPDLIRALHSLDAPLCACAPIAALRILGSKVDHYSCGVVQAAASRWLAAPSAEAAAEVAATFADVRLRMEDADVREATSALVDGLRDTSQPAWAIASTERFASALTRFRFIPVLEEAQGRRLLAWRALDEALSWARGRESRVARPRGFEHGRYFDERRDEGNWFNNDIEHFVVDAWTGDWVFEFHGNERNSSDTYEGCYAVQIDEENRQVIVRHHGGEPDEKLPLPDEAQR